MSNSVWDGIHDVFGDGHDYDWALVGDDEDGGMAEDVEPDVRYQDVSRTLL
jgi:transcription elongation factor SPT6